jgi:hypothetical protein
MPTLGQDFLQALTNPQLNEGLFNLGSAIGGVPGRYKEKKKKQTYAEEANTVKKGSQAYFNILASQASRDGDTALEERYITLGRQALLNERGDREYEQEQKGKIDDAQNRFDKLDNILSRSNLTEQQKNAAHNLRRALAVAGEAPGQGLIKSYDDFIEKTTPDVYSTKDYIELSKEFKLDSLEAFKKSVDLGTPDHSLLVRKDPRVTTSKPQYKEMVNPDTGEPGLYLMNGQQAIYVGTVPKKTQVMSPSEALIFDKVRTDRTKAANDAVKFQRLAMMADDSTWLRTGAAGGALNEVELQLGLQGEAALFRASLNEIQVSGALEMLPSGPASDKDVALAMSTQINLNNLTPAEAASYLRGMAKIAKAREAFLEKKLEYIEVTGDANALGFDAWAATQGAQKGVDEMVTKLGSSVQSVRNKILDISKIQDPQKKLKAIADIKGATAVQPGGYSLSDVYAVLENQTRAENRWNKQKATNSKLEGFY